MKKFKKAASIFLALLLALGTGSMSAMAADEGLSNVENGVYTDTIDIVENESPGPSTDNEVKAQPDDTGNGDAPITEDDNKIELSGAVKSLTAGGQVDGNIVTFGAGTNLSYTAEGNDEGRDSDCWWAGIEITAPEGAAENAQYQKITQWWNDADGTSAAWGSATAWSDNNDGTFWVPVKPEYFKSYGNTLNYRYQFDWNGDGTYEQQVTVKVTNDVALSGIEGNPAARIGGVGYKNLNEAIKDAVDGQTVYVLKNTAFANLQTAKHVTVNIPANVKVSGTSYALAAAKKGAVLTITGEGTVKGGDYGIIAQSNGTVNIEGCTIEGGKYGVYTRSNGNANIAGGTISGKYGVLSLGAKVSVTGENVQIIGTVGSGIAAQGAGTEVHITAGKVTGNNYGLYLYNGPSASVEDNAQITGAQAGIAVFGGPKETTALTGDARTKLTVDGNCVIESADYGIAGNGSNDGTIIEINSGTITGGITAIYHPQVGDMTINGGTITGQNGVQFTGAGNLTVTGGNITSTLEYTESPQKPPTHTDGTVADGAALSMVSRGSGWQKDGETMNVTISGGYFTSLNNSAVAVYRIKQQADKTWTVGDDTGLPSYLKNLTITGGTFTGNVQQKDVLYIDHLADNAVSISGGYFNQDIDDTEEVDTVYVTEGYASHAVNKPANYFHVHQPDFYGKNDYGINDDEHWQGCKGDNHNCIEGKHKEAHNWNDGVVTTWPTYTSEGVRTFTCVICGHEKYEQIPRVIDTSGTVIPDPDVPLGPGPDNPDNPDTPDNPIIDDPDVPLAPLPELPEDEYMETDGKPTDPKQPRTGDETPLLALTGILLASVGTLGTILIRRKEKTEK